MSIAVRYKFIYYDALIWATAIHHGVPKILSEDMQYRQVIDGVTLINPFAPNFDLAMLDSV